MMKRHIKTLKILTLLVALVIPMALSIPASASDRLERRAILEGNKLYKEGKYLEAAKEYEEALKKNPGSAEATYNLGLTQVRRAEATQVDSLRQSFLQAASSNFGKVAALKNDKRALASKADYNLGNIAFQSEDYARAVASYKQALRLNPNDEDARRNLRIAQKKLQQNQDDKDDNKDKDKQNQDDRKDQDKKDQDKQENQDQNQDKENRQDQQQQQPREPEINPQTADQILKAMENKENELRARVMKANNGQQAAGAASRQKKW